MSKHKSLHQAVSDDFETVSRAFDEIKPTDCQEDDKPSAFMRLLMDLGKEQSKMSHKNSANTPEIFTGRPEATGYPAFEHAASLGDFVPQALFHWGPKGQKPEIWALAKLRNRNQDSSAGNSPFQAMTLSVSFSLAWQILKPSLRASWLRATRRFIVRKVWS